MISEKIFKEFPPKAIKMLVIIFNAVLRIKYFPISIEDNSSYYYQNQKKGRHLPSSYQPICFFR